MPCFNYSIYILLKCGNFELSGKTIIKILINIWQFPNSMTGQIVKADMKTSLSGLVEEGRKALERLTAPEATDVNLTAIATETLKYHHSLEDVERELRRVFVAEHEGSGYADGIDWDGANRNRLAAAAYYSMYVQLHGQEPTKVDSFEYHSLMKSRSHRFSKPLPMKEIFGDSRFDAVPEIFERKKKIVSDLIHIIELAMSYVPFSLSNET